MKRALVALLFGCMALGLTSLAYAGNNSQASIVLHVAPYVQKNQCTSVGPLTNATIVTEATCDTTDAFTVYLLVCNGSGNEDPANPGTGVAGLQCGITYDGMVGAGVDVDSWTLCADLDFPDANWPNAGGGTTITWDPNTNCQIQNSEPYVPNTVIAVAGAFNVFLNGPDVMAVIPRPVDGRAKVADCNAAEDDITGKVPSQLGQAGFCLTGYNPCGLPTPVENTTWGNIKKSY
jgi:hypothetical protein